MTEKELLRERLEEAFRTSPYHSFLRSIRGVSEEDARRVPPGYRGFAHMNGSILSLAFHTAGDKHVLISHAFGDASVDWPSVQSRFAQLGGTLSAAMTIAQEGHDRVLHTLDELADGDLAEERPYYGGRFYPARRIFSIIAEHDLYHAGQIQLVRNLLAGSHAAGDS